MNIRLNLAQLHDLPDLLALLDASGLPRDGLSEHITTAVVARAGDRVVGSAALELYGAAALLRSVAVAPALRGQGLGARLVRHALDLACQRDVGAAYLLTQTAADFFARFGFEPIARAEAAPAVQQSVEFTSACPASAQAMRLLLARATRAATPHDAEAIARIYNQGIEDRVGTFETRPRSAADVQAWFDGQHPVVVAVEAGEVVAFASTSTYRARDCYAGIAEFSVYVARVWRGRGAGRLAMRALIDAAAAAGFWKLVSRVFVENTASRALLGSLGFREVGVYEKHGRLDGAWRDVVIVELLIAANL
jgi:phosphinothricin acetyltransferase